MHRAQGARPLRRSRGPHVGVTALAGMSFLARIERGGASRRASSRGRSAPSATSSAGSARMASSPGTTRACTATRSRRCSLRARRGPNWARTAPRRQGEAREGRSLDRRIAERGGRLAVLAGRNRFGPLRHRLPARCPARGAEAGIDVPDDTLAARPRLREELVRRPSPWPRAPSTINSLRRPRYAAVTRSRSRPEGLRCSRRRASPRRGRRGRLSSTCGPIGPLADRGRAPVRLLLRSPASR